MAVTASMVKELRDRTALGMMDCKKALTEADGDLELAIENLRKSSALKAAKKSGRTTADGLLGLKVADDGKRAALVEINIETDFAAKNAQFIEFVDEVTTAVFDKGEADLEKLGFKEKRERLVQEIGENITLRRASFIESSQGQIYSYLHSDNRKACLIELEGGDSELGKDVAMHITAIRPTVVRGEDVDPAVVAKEREIYSAQAQESGKPPEIVEKMIEGRVRKFLSEISLVDQAFAKDGNVKVGALLKQAGAEAVRFVRFEVGEGIEVEKEDFAAEVAAQIKGK